MKDIHDFKARVKELEDSLEKAEKNFDAAAKSHAAKVFLSHT